MLRIGICEDDVVLAKQLHELLVQILFRFTEVKIQYFTDGQEVVDAVLKGLFAVDLLFLDIHMKELDGMKTAEFIRNTQIDVDIIFLTVSQKHVFDGYHYRAFAYWLKPLDQERIEKDLKRYLVERHQITNTLTVSIKGKEYNIGLDRVLYFESDKRKVIAHTSTEQIEFHAKLDDVESMVKSKGFLRCHQSYLINYQKVDAIERTQVLIQGISVPMSRKYYEKLKGTGDKDRNITVIKSLALNQKQSGAIIFTKGELLGTYIRINEGKTIWIGRDAAQVDIVLNESAVSRRHCSIVYNGNGKYTVCDFSKNGMQTEEGTILPSKCELQFQAGYTLSIGNEKNQICLG